MAAKADRRAYDEFLEPLSRAVFLVTGRVLLGEGHQGGGIHALSLPGDPPFGKVVVPAVHGDVLLSLLQQYWVERNGGVRIHTAAYSYGVYSPQNELILRYDYHPDSRSPVTWPHLHLRTESWFGDLARTHIPTGRVSLESVLRFLITDLGLRRLARPPVKH